MRHINRLLSTSTKVLGPNTVEAIAGTSQRARDGHIVVMRGMDISAFLRSGTILWGHDPNAPVGVPTGGRVDSDGNLRLEIEFAPDGTSEKADETKRMVKAGIVRNLSIGFDVIEAEPITPNRPRDGMKITRSELLEVSFVSVPADTGAIVTARRLDREGKKISAANMTKLKSAHAAIMEAGGHVSDVMGMNDQDGDEGERSADFRRRQAECLALARPEHEFWAAREAKRHAELDEELRDPAARRREAARLAAVRY